MKRHHLKECHPYLHFKSDGQCVYEMVLLFTLNTLDSFLYLLKSMSCIFCLFKYPLSHICLDLTGKYRKEFKIIIDCVLLYNSFCVTVHSLFDHLGVQWHALAFTVCCSVDCLFFVCCWVLDVKKVWGLPPLRMTGQRVREKRYRQRTAWHIRLACDGLLKQCSIADN